MPKPKISVPNQFKKIKVGKPKTKREDRVEEKEKVLTPWFQVEPYSTLIFNGGVGLGCTICFLAFGNFFDPKIILKFLASSFISYIIFEELPTLYARLKA